MDGPADVCVLSVWAAAGRLPDRGPDVPLLKAAAKGFSGLLTTLGVGRLRTAAVPEGEFVADFL